MPTSRRRPDYKLMTAAALVAATMAAVAIGGCSAGDTARLQLGGPALKQGWPPVKRLAEVGLLAHQDPDFVAKHKLGEPYSPGVAASHQLAIDKHGELIGAITTPAAGGGR